MEKTSDSACKPQVSTGIEVPGTELTLALIKPDAIRAGKLNTILHVIKQQEFVVVGSKQTQLTRVRAEEFYDEHEGKYYFDKLVRFMSSGPVHAFILGKTNAVQAWNVLIGPADPQEARQRSPSSIRALYGTDTEQNAVHGSTTYESARREIKFFFSNVILDPVLNESLANEYFDQHLKSVIVKGLTALAKEKPHSDPLEVIKWLALWLQQNNPNKPYVDGSRPLTIP